MTEPLRLSLQLKTLPVILVGENGEERNYTITELTGRERNKYLTKMTSRVKVDKRGNIAGFKTFDGTQSDLLRMCLKDEAGEPMSVEDIEEIPSEAQEQLFKAAQELSGLNKGLDADAEKND